MRLKARLRAAWEVVRETVRQFLDDEALTYAASLAFYTTLSLAPLVLLLVSAGAFLGEDARDHFRRQIADLLGPAGGDTIDVVLESAAERRKEGRAAALLGIGAMLFSATAVFAQFQVSMNRIWGVTARPGQGLLNWVRKRLLSLAMVVTIGFLLLVSLVVSAGLGLVLERSGSTWQVLDFTISFAIFTVLFAITFKVLPDVRIAWRDTWIGAVLTAGLFGLGKFAIGRYLGATSVGSAYGPAGSLAVLLVWVYYSALIVLFGAELTQVLADVRGRGIVPDDHAIPVRRRSVAADQTVGRSANT